MCFNSEPDSAFQAVEHARLTYLRTLDILDGARFDDLDTIVRLAAHSLKAPIALVSLVDEHRQVFVSRYGLDVTETPRSSSFCSHAINHDDLMIVPDTLEDARFRLNPLVTGAPGIRFYAGAPLTMEGGYRIGTLCIIDRAHRSGLSPREKTILKLMASQVVSILGAHRSRKQQRILQLIAETTNDAFVCADASSRIIFWNRAAEAMFGWTAGEAVGSSLDLIIPHRHRSAHHAGVRRIRSTGLTKLVGKTVEVPAICRAGEELPVELSLAMWPDDGQPECFAAIIRDVSARKLAEEDRAATEAKLAQQVAAIEASDDGIALTDAQGKFVFMNRACSLMFGYDDTSSLAGQPWSILYEPAEAQRIEAVAIPVLATVGQWRGETLGRRRDGSPVAQEIVLSRGPGDGIVCVARDIAARRVMEREKIRLREQLMVAQRQEAIGQLAMGISHDFNNIIAAIAGTGELLLGIDDSRVRQHAARICSAADTAARLTEKLLTLSRRTPNYTTVDLHRIVREACSLVVPSLTYPGHSIEVDLPSSPLMAVADETEVTQVVLNLAVNARDALSAGVNGTIRVEVFDAGQYQIEGRLLLGHLPTAPAAVIRVSDNGCGMCPETLDQIFDPFFSSKSHKGRGGNGLGLAVVAGIISSNGGAIGIKTAVGRGTTFEVWWPLKATESATRGTLPRSVAKGRILHGKAVLIIDDNQPVLETLSDMLEEAGAEVGACSDPHDAISAVREDPGSWDLVLTDYDMPVMNGAELGRVDKRDSQSLRVLIQDCFLRSNHGSWGLVGCGVGTDRAAAAA